MSRLTRRQVFRVATGVAAGAALAGAATVATATGPSTSKKPAPGAGGPAAFDEVYKGRHIQGAPDDSAAARAQGQGGHGHGHAHGHNGHATYRVLIDGRELQVMRHNKSGWSSPVNHYERFTSPREAARAAVLTLKGAHVVPFTPTV
ncbi:apotyrosinase chaperone MelC1 [Streptomyces sp. JNUCC 64]